MLVGATPDVAIEVCTARRRRQSSEHDLRRGLRTFGFLLTKFDSWLNGPALPSRDRMTVPHVPGTRVLARVRFEWNRRAYHWIAIAGGRVHDPAFQKPCDIAAYERFLWRRRGYITSWARVLSPAEAAA